MRLATFKHISSKSADYAAAEEYLAFEHDEFTNKAIRDENGKLIPRKYYRIETVNCGGEDYAIACLRANLRYGKNQRKEDVKSHHYIISFDPRGAEDNGLTLDKAQELGLRFAREHFPGHQMIVAAHDDGHHHSGNIHVHIVFNSLRISDVERLPYMDRPSDTKAGMKHRCTDAAMEYFRSEVMEMCHRENLYQIDLLHGCRERITEKEYRAKARGQNRIDQENTARKKDGAPIIHTKYETDKEKLRKVIRTALKKAGSMEEFCSLLLQQGITVRESRGRFSYLTPERTKPITSRRLGDGYSKEAVLSAIEDKKQKLQKTESGRKENSGEYGQEPTLSRLVDIEKKRAEGKGKGYEYWAKIFNLKQTGNTLIYLQENGIHSIEKLVSFRSGRYEQMNAALIKLKETETALQKQKNLREQIVVYRRTLPVIREYRKLPEKKRRVYREAHNGDFLLYGRATRELKAALPDGKIPSVKMVQEEIERLISEKNNRYNDYREAKKNYQEAVTAESNIRKTLKMPEAERHSGREPR